MFVNFRILKAQGPSWCEEFNSPTILWGQKWIGHTTSAYGLGNKIPEYCKLEVIRQENTKFENGQAVFRAWPTDRDGGTPIRDDKGKVLWYSGKI